jgi:hypothetical protein
VDPGVLTTLETALRAVHRPGPLETVWNWRWEAAIVVSAGTAAGVIVGVGGLIGLSAAAGAGLAILSAMLCWSPARSWLIARAWCLITPHRVRAAFVHAWVQNRTGRIPFVLSTRPAPYGQEVRLWLRAGLTVDDLEAASQVLAAACWATEVAVVPSARYAHLATLEVIRKLQPEPARPAPRPWPDPRYAPGGGLGDTDDRDTVPGPSAAVPRQRPADEDWLRPPVPH